MAFTIAHMAAALPFRRCRWLCLEALFIGTMMPDLPYYVNVSGKVAKLSHQWSGLISYCLPWGLLVFALWNWLFKPAVTGLSSLYSISRWDNSTTNHRAPYLFKPWLTIKVRWWSKVTLGLLIGASTHLLWDSITHPSGFIAQQVGWLQYPLSVGNLGEDIKMARLLQYLSSLVGLLLLARFAWLGLNTQHHSISYLNSNALMAQSAITSAYSKASGLKKWHSVLIVFSILLNASYWGWQEAKKRQYLISVDNYTFLAETSVSLLQGAIVALILYAVAYQLVYFVRYELIRH
jgi:hypothetical protein